MKNLNDKASEMLAQLCLEELEREEMQAALDWLDSTLRRLVAEYETEDWDFLRGKVLVELIRQIDKQEGGR